MNRTQDRSGIYYSDEEGEVLAKILYVIKDDHLVIEHTIVSEKLKGQGLGKKLVDEVEEYAKKEGLNLQATCPFAKAYLDKKQN